jgi:hypothetical protein
VGRLWKWVAAIAAVTGIARLLRRRRRAPVDGAEGAIADDPAAELRRKLSETRDAPPDTDDAPTAPTTEGADGASLEERRARIHEKAQQAIDAMTTEEP